VDRVAVALGSNLGDRRAHLDYAVARLRTVIDDLDASSYYETRPQEVGEAQPWYLNAAVVGDTRLSAHDLLRTLLMIEAERGRERPHHHAARTLDLDLVLYADAVIHDHDLVVPHPRFAERRFVLEPLAEIAPGLRDPVSGKTVRELLQLCRDGAGGRQSAP